MLLARSAPEGEADEIAMNPDIDTRRSAVGDKADTLRMRLPGLPLASLIDAGCGLRPLTVSLPISTFEANALGRLALVVDHP